METTVCPWCQTEIVWDEEIGPEEECPHCHNELKGYRTLNVTLSDDEEELQEELEEESYNSDSSWMDEEESSSPRTQGLTRLPSLDGNDTDLLAYESAIGKILETQDQMPECPHCREYMILTGKNMVKADGYSSVTPAGLKHPLLEAPIRMNVYVCPSCFHVSSFLTDEDRIRFAGRVQQAAESNEN
ncbi:hypothetical protein [Paenibacillus physcomitrellae]|uniref:Uncharacterized protein n=1 Tax=Paenibacillus physcomitrellae TaxID=1619311 RepID=A0ABQ1G7E9_9BACL|nr:hypothetical protein [Paenibacillus physcomitrellae]GGA38226.1 hypothetical protein GCM10010917_24370 [Paenibacillus physcomitrellae]